jgi:hypothetical protein
LSDVRLRRSQASPVTRERPEGEFFVIAVPGAAAEDAHVLLPLGQAQCHRCELAYPHGRTRRGQKAGRCPVLAAQPEPPRPAQRMMTGRGGQLPQRVIYFLQRQLS